MQAVYVHDRVTPYSFDVAADAMRGALSAELGAPPSRECLALALAKCALETGRWRAIHQHNFGNIKAGESYVGQYCTFELNEVLRENGKDVVVWFGPRGRLSGKGGKVVAEGCEDPPGHPQTRMRAHANVYDGAYAYVDFMVRGAKGRFLQAFNFMRVGNVQGMVEEMKRRGYFTADLGAYLSAVASINREFLGKLNGQRPDPVELTDAEYEAFRTYHNEELLETWSESEYERLLTGPNLGGGRAMLEHERDTEAERNSAKPDDSDPNPAA